MSARRRCLPTDDGRRFADELFVSERLDHEEREVGAAGQGYYVYDVWESREAFERFMEEKLGPAIGEVMGGPPPEGGGPQYFPVDVLIVSH